MESYINEITSILNQLDLGKVEKFVKKIEETHKRGSTVFIIGNGGSASTASHWVCDLNKGTLKSVFKSSYKRIKAVSLVDNVALITAFANDFDYEEIFSQQLLNLAGEGDLLVVMTGSGKSKNIINALNVARKSGVYIFSLLGFGGGEAANVSDDFILIPSKNYGIIED